ncbi:unnamed protein product [Didymodactylos carnosus]|uniref:Uncharacterized protein n=1 Tax=Didymodactylos carnosus TaxID=1234261 RepID=A0A813YIA1_9BILA|nr:unnamed protein product [Didymodactylos carnosus]CAF0884671.1 unnamed protein product [Didymodactylos carnosus]CAF3511428.1 unnamed protein product [Didymodactylos carnosus]CAF3670139.1 unnamed protein product [Didymodactylos carnosus]
MELVFLGTGSNNPTPHRGASSLALRQNGLVYLFDCGEGTQIQLMKSNLKFGRITKIFITHLHGDHLFGLSGLLCSLSSGMTKNQHENDGTETESQDVAPSVILYGPLGLRKYVETTLSLSSSKLVFKYDIYELIPNPDDGIILSQDDTDVLFKDSQTKTVSAEFISDPSHEKGGYYQYHLSTDDNCNVYAVSIKHRLPTYGFIIIENNLPGKFDIQKLQKEHGLKPGPFCSKLKAGEQVTLESGLVLKPEEFVGPSRTGRKIVILGDCSNAMNIIPLAMNCDILVHEATHDDTLKEKAIEFGHSTPSMAADVAEKCNAKCLLLNHFSQRYRPVKQEGKLDSTNAKKAKNEDTEDDITTDLLLSQAKQCYPSRPVFIAEDFFTYTLQLPK